MGLKLNLSGTVNEAVFMSRLYTWMHFGLRFSVQVFRNQIDNRPNPRDMYGGTPFCRCFSVQVRLVQKQSNVMNMKEYAPGAIRSCTAIWCSLLLFLTDHHFE